MNEIFKDIGKEIGKGALSALGGVAMTGLASLVGLGDDTGAQLEKLAGKLDHISVQLDRLSEQLTVLHQDLQGISHDLRDIKVEIAGQARLSRLTDVMAKLEDARILVDVLFARLAQVPRLDPRDGATEVRALAVEVLSGEAVSRALESLGAALIGHAEVGSALGMLSEIYVADINAGSAMGGLADPQRIEVAYANRLVPFFLQSVAVQIKGVVLLMNALAVTDRFSSTASRSAAIDAVRDAHLKRLQPQIDAFLAAARRLAAEDWPHEYVYWHESAAGRVIDPGHYAGTGIQARSDALADQVLAREPGVVIRLFVSHTVPLAEQPGMTSSAEAIRLDRERNRHVAETLAGAMGRIADKTWWTPASLPSAQFDDSVQHWPALRPRLMQMLFQPTAWRVEQRLDSASFVKDRTDFLAIYLPALAAAAGSAIARRSDGEPLFDPVLQRVRLPCAAGTQQPWGSLNLATYYHLGSR